MYGALQHFIEFDLGDVAGRDAREARARNDHDAHGSSICVDLFCGAGGFSLGAIQAGFEVWAAVEYFRHAAATYRKQIRNFSGREIAMFESDILELDPRELMDVAGLREGRCGLLLGGPPCQGFSSHRLGSSGVDDPRNTLLLRYFAFLKAIRPKVFLLENVPGMLQAKHAAYVKKFQAMARSCGYEVQEPVLINARDYGVPQNRKRAFIVGHNPRRVAFDINWPPKPTHGDPARSGPGGRLQPWRTASVAFERPAPPNDLNDVHMSHGPELTAVFESTPLNGGSRSQSNRLLPCHKSHDGHKDVYGRIDPSRPSPTMTAACINPSKGRFVHPTEHHGITARQAARLQSFPDEFTFEGGLMASGIQIGNAVPVRLSKVLCDHLRRILASDDPLVETGASKIKQRDRIAIT